MNTADDIKNITVCRLCLNYTTDFTFLASNESPLLFQVGDCLPNINLEVSENPLICASCSTAIQQFHTFKAMCTNNESQITYYCKEIVKLESGNKIVLNEVLDYQKELDNVKVEVIELFVETSDYPVNDQQTSNEEQNNVNCSQNEFVKVVKVNKVVRKSRGRSYVKKCDQKDDNSKDSPEIENLDVLQDGQIPKETKNPRKSVVYTEQFKCELCPKVFVRKHCYDRHITNHDEQTLRKKYLCTLCGKAFRKSNYLTAHMKFHTNYRPACCQLCDKSFRTSGCLKDHMRTHTGERRFQCPVCSKLYSNSMCYRKHLLIHEEEAKLAESGVQPARAFPCTMCDEQFHVKPDLLIHMKKHNFGAFGCDQCDKRFYDQTRLTRHRLIHTGLKPFNCTVCGKGFNRNSNMLLHRRKVHAESKNI